MTKQVILKAIDARIDEAAHKKKYSKKYVAETLQGIRAMVSDIDKLEPAKDPYAECADRIMKAVCKVTGLTKEEIKTPKRTSQLIRARKIFSVCATQMTKAKLDVIGKYIGKHRTTVLFHLGKHDSDMEYYPEYRDEYCKVCEILQNGKNNQTQNR